MRRADILTIFIRRCPETWEPQHPGTVRACLDLYNVCLPIRVPLHPSSYPASLGLPYFSYLINVILVEKMYLA